MAQTRRVLIFCGGGLEHAGGIGRVLGNLIEASRAAKRPYAMPVIDTRGPYSIFVSPVFFAAALARTVFAACAKGRVAAHVNMAHAGSTVRKVMVCRLLALLRVPYLLHLHANNYDTYFRAQPGWRKALIRQAFAGAERIVVLGILWRDLVVDEIGVPARKVLVIRNGAADPGQPAAPRQDACPLILFLADLRPWKGIGELIEALGSEALRAEPWKLVCAGRGLPAAYQAAAEQAGIGDRVSFAGWLPRDAVQGLLRQSSILALPSHMEGLSVTLVEALAHGVPVVATAVGAHPDILRDRENAIVVQVRDPASLAQGLMSLLRDKDEAARIGRGGRSLFEHCLEIGRVEEEFHAVYEGLFRARRPSPRGISVSDAPAEAAGSKSDR